LVPGILPPTSSMDLNHEHEAFLVVASLDKIKMWTDFKQTSYHCLKASHIRQQGVLPMGIFPRLLSKIVTQMQRVEGLDIIQMQRVEGVDKIHLSAHCAKLEMEGCKFTCSLDFDITGSIRVGFWGPGPPNHLVLSILKELADEVLRENKGHLDCAFAVAVPNHDEMLLTWLSAIQEAVAQSSKLRVKASTLPHDQVKQTFGMWLVSSGPAEDGSYDVFFSHRHVDFDVQFADDLFCRLNSCHHSEAGHLFLDKYCIPRGVDYRTHICDALSRTRVAVPIISHAALDSMSERVKRNDPDTLLFDWILIL